MWIGFPNVGGRAIPSQRYSEARATVGDGGDAQASLTHLCPRPLFSVTSGVCSLLNTS
jgi:hypothetical protein